MGKEVALYAVSPGATFQNGVRGYTTTHSVNRYKVGIPDEDRMCKEVLFEGSMDECKLFIQSRGYYCQLLERNSI